MNIQTALKQIHSAGMTDAQVGEAINAPQSIVTRLRNGIHKTTSFERGQKIIELAQRVKQKEAA